MMDSGCGYMEGEVYTTHCYLCNDMQLLGVVNQPPPQDVWYFVCVCVCNDIMLLKGMPIEEVYTRLWVTR